MKKLKRGLGKQRAWPLVTLLLIAAVVIVVVFVTVDFGAHNVVDMGFYDAATIGYGPGGHNYLFHATDIDVMNNKRNRRYLAIERRDKREGQCGKITDYKVQHAQNLPRCFDETPDADNYFEDIRSAIASVDNKQWFWGTASLRYIKNGENEPSRCLVKRLGMPAFCTRFKPTFFANRGAIEDNVNFSDEVQNRYNYKFYNNVTIQDFKLLLNNVYAEECQSGDPAPCVCDTLRLKPGCFKLCDTAFLEDNVTIDPENTNYDCSTTLDDYLLRYSLKLEYVNPFTGVDSRVDGPHPADVCYESFTLHQYYARALGFKNATHEIPNFEAAEHICAFNVGYFGDCYGSHEPCAYIKWNTIEYSTYPEFCYMSEGLSSLCRGMRDQIVDRVAALGGTLTERYGEEVLSINIDDVYKLIKITTVVLATGERQLYKVRRDESELVINVPPRDLNRMSGNLIDYLRTVKQPLSEDGTQGGAHFITQPKGASPLSVNVVLRRPFFAFLFDEKHMSGRIVGQTGYHSRGEYYNDPDHRRTNIVRAIYSDFWMQNEWSSIFDCIQRGECTDDDIRNMLIFEWKTMFPEQPDIQAMTKEDILDVFANKTQDGWHWQAPGNHNTPEALVAWAANPVVDHPTFKNYAIGLINSGWDLSRDGWVTASFHCVYRFLSRLPHYDISNEEAHWDEVRYCGLRPDGQEIDPTLAFSNEYPHMANSSSPTGYYFPYEIDSDGQVSLVDATYGTYNGVIITGQVGQNYTYQTCRYQSETRRCEPVTFSDDVSCPSDPFD